ncbi:hypothetical protein [Brevibacillus dissolubilis]|uniref:hypothetical protein n=1 Tax=Brevibacillus dissolubilis TaxID=1844116 RepID=UPI001115BD09|nr:hypothetical protein [Brevibacillus dissolubilis]
MSRQEEYNTRYKKLSERVEKGIVTLVAVCIAGLVGGQFLYAFDPIRQMLVETVRLEGAAQVP